MYPNYATVFPLSGLFLGRLHFHHQSYPNACSFVYCDWSSLFTTLYCLCSPCKSIGLVSRVHQTGGNRSGRSGPVPVWAGTKPAQIQNSNLN